MGSRAWGLGTGTRRAGDGDHRDVGSPSLPTRWLDATALQSFAKHAAVPASTKLHFVRSTLECARRRAAALGGWRNRRDSQRVMLAPARNIPPPSQSGGSTPPHSKASRNVQ